MGVMTERIVSHLPRIREVEKSMTHDLAAHLKVVQVTASELQAQRNFVSSRSNGPEEGRIEGHI